MSSGSPPGGTSPATSASRLANTPRDSAGTSARSASRAIPTCGCCSSTGRARCCITRSRRQHRRRVGYVGGRGSSSPFAATTRRPWPWPTSWRGSRGQSGGAGAPSPPQPLSDHVTDELTRGCAAHDTDGAPAPTGARGKPASPMAAQAAVTIGSPARPPCLRSPDTGLERSPGRATYGWRSARSGSGSLSSPPVLGARGAPEKVLSGSGTEEGAVSAGGGATSSAGRLRDDAFELSTSLVVADSFATQSSQQAGGALLKRWFLGVFEGRTLPGIWHAR